MARSWARMVGPRSRGSLTYHPPRHHYYHQSFHHSRYRPHLPNRYRPLHIDHRRYSSASGSMLPSVHHVSHSSSGGAACNGLPRVMWTGSACSFHNGRGVKSVVRDTRERLRALWLVVQGKPRVTKWSCKPEELNQIRFSCHHSLPR